MQQQQTIGLQYLHQFSEQTFPQTYKHNISNLEQRIEGKQGKNGIKTFKKDTQQESKHHHKLQNQHKQLLQISKQLLPQSCQYSDFSNIQKNSENTNASKTGQNIFTLLQWADNFKCPFCHSSEQFFCGICKGNREIQRDNSLINFLTFVVEFKLGMRKSYPKELQSSLNSQCPPLRTAKGQTISVHQNIHYRYFCNGCNNDEPIRGLRFHCSVCQDYDLCQSCFRQKGHAHQMIQVPISLSYKYNVKYLQQLKQKQSALSLHSLRDIRNRLQIIQQKRFGSCL